MYPVFFSQAISCSYEYRLANSKRFVHITNVSIEPFLTCHTAQEPKTIGVSFLSSFVRMQIAWYVTIFYGQVPHMGRGSVQLFAPSSKEVASEEILLTHQELRS